MDIIIKETGEMKELVTSNGVDAGAIADIIGNEDGFGNDFDGSIVAVDDACNYVTSQDNFDWWQGYLNEYCA